MSSFTREALFVIAPDPGKWFTYSNTNKRQIIIIITALHSIKNCLKLLESITETVRRIIAVNETLLCEVYRHVIELYKKRIRVH